MQHLARPKNINSIAQNTLKHIQQAIGENDSVIHLDGDFYLTKGISGRSSGYILRDRTLEEDSLIWMNSRSSYSKLINRYKKYDPALQSLAWPRHYATRFINIKGNIAAGENIFMFFPEVLGFHTKKIDDYFGFEFIDMWVSIFDEIVFPCMRKIFDEESQLILYSTLRPVLEKTIYLASVFHEIGHRCGIWKVSPEKDVRISINKFNTDVLGELATDTLLANFLSEFPEVLYFVFLQRLFWFGRFGFKSNPLSGKLNEDNDTWIGSYLWNKYMQLNAIVQNDDRSWHVNFINLKRAFNEVHHDTDSLGDKVANCSIGQDDIIKQWMQDNVKSINGIFYLPEALQAIFIRCVSVRETPTSKF